jgi:hypothetical protein
MALSRYNSLSILKIKKIKIFFCVSYYIPKYKLKSWKLRFGISDRIRHVFAFSEFDSQIIRHISSTNAFVWKVAFIKWPRRFQISII